MNNILKILIIIFLLQIGNNLCSQSDYFNNLYFFNTPDVWSAGKDLIDVGDGYVITGATGDTLNYYWNRIGIMKIDYSGNKLWGKDYGDTTARYFTSDSRATHQIDNECFYVSGAKQYYNPNTYNVGLLMRFNSEWDTIWAKEYSWDYILPKDTSIGFRQMYICDNKNLLFVGTFNDDAIGSKIFLLKADSIGNTQWIKIYGYGGSILNSGYSVTQTTDSGFAIGGFKYTPGHPETGDPIVIKTDSMGNQKWMKNLGGPYLDNKAMLSLDYDGNILVGTTYGDEMSGDDVFSRINIIKLDNEGNILWNRKYGESKLYNCLFNIRVLEDNSIIAVGTMPDVFPHTIGWLIKVNNNGDSLWYREYDILHGYQSMNLLRDVIETSDNGFLSCGYAYPMQPDTGTQDVWVIKLDSIGCDTPGCDTTVAIPEIAYKNTEDELYIYPNPASNILNIEYPITNDECRSIISIYDVFGRKAKEIKVPNGQQQLNVNVSNWHNGLYFAVLRNNKKYIAKQKFMVLR